MFRTNEAATESNM